MQSKTYTALVVILGIFYFIDVFAGMIVLENQYKIDGAPEYNLYRGHHYSLVRHPYDIVEIALLSLILVESTVKIMIAVSKKDHLVSFFKKLPLQGSYIKLRHLNADFFIIIIQIALFIIEVFSSNPVVVGFLRLRCILRFPFLYMMLVRHCYIKVRYSINKCSKQGLVKPINMPRENFRTYKEKVVYILQKINEDLGESQELSWCLHVIKNDFLQISNSIMSNP